MSRFHPTHPPAGRLARLGVVLDADDASSAKARLCDRAGIDIVWVMDRGKLGAMGPAGPIAAAAAAIAGTLERIALGVAPSSPDDAAALGTSAPLVELASNGRLEVVNGARRLDRPPEPGLQARRSMVLQDLSELAAALPDVDDIVLPAWRFDDLETAADEVRAAAGEAGRDPESLGVATLLPVSIGRTRAEAEARVAADPLFRVVGDPADVGIFGTLEECQDRVIALAHAGITDLRCILPSTLDIHDVIAQLTAITIGTIDVLVPGSLRSPAPPPPDGWGGRAPAPPIRQVSGGSRRR